MCFCSGGTGIGVEKWSALFIINLKIKRILVVSKSDSFKDVLTWIQKYRLLKLFFKRIAQYRFTLIENLWTKDEIDLDLDVLDRLDKCSISKHAQSSRCNKLLSFLVVEKVQVSFKLSQFSEIKEIIVANVENNFG